MDEWIEKFLGQVQWKLSYGRPFLLPQILMRGKIGACCTGLYLMRHMTHEELLRRANIENMNVWYATNDGHTESRWYSPGLREAILKATGLAS